MDGIFGVDWNQDGQVDIVEDMITADVLGLFDNEEEDEANLNSRYRCKIIHSLGKERKENG